MNATSAKATLAKATLAGAKMAVEPMHPAGEPCRDHTGGGLRGGLVVLGDGPRWEGRNRPLQGLAGSSIEGRFRAWTGGSGRRYVFSVFPLGLAAGGIEDLPTGGTSIVIGVERRGDGARLPVFIAESGSAPEAFFRGDLVDALRSRGPCELHVHLTAADGAQRRGIVADLAA